MIFDVSKTWPPLLKIEHRGQTAFFFANISKNVTFSQNLAEDNIVQLDKVHLCWNFQKDPWTVWCLSYGPWNRLLKQGPLCRLQSLSSSFFSIFTENFDGGRQFSQGTTESDWSQARKSQQNIFNDAMKTLSDESYPLLRMRSQPSKMYYVRQAKYAIELICESIAPDQSKDWS